MTIDREWFERCAFNYMVDAADSDFPLQHGDTVYPCDDRAGGSTIDAHYAHMDLWAARAVIRRRTFSMPPHVDVGSRVDGFCTHLLASGLSVEHVDIRAPTFMRDGFYFATDDARTLATFPDESVASLSCLHVAEHVGLGRYGDEIDPQGMAKCMRSLARVLAPGGRLYFAVPVGRQRVCFNAHRIASPSWVARMFAEAGLTLQSFAAVDDAGRFVTDARPEDYEEAVYACGCFEFRKAER